MSIAVVYAAGEEVDARALVEKLKDLSLCTTDLPLGVATLRLGFVEMRF
jgi:hypothetical protein